MYNTIFCLSICALLATKSYSQNSKPAQVADITKISILNPGISYEHGTAPYQSLFARAYLTTLTGAAYSYTFGYTVQFDFDPGIAVQYRMYYNAAKRHRKGRRTDLNNLNYLAPVSKIILSKRPVYSNSQLANHMRPIYTLGALWGIQRNYRNHFSVDFNIGPGVLLSKDKVYSGGQEVDINASQFTIAGQFTLGFWLKKRGH